MSKSIYEEALEKINIEFDAWERSEKIEVIEIIEESLEQAQKQEKLLSKIKEIIDRQDDSYISSMLEESQKYYEIKKLMNKEKENEKE